MKVKVQTLDARQGGDIELNDEISGSSRAPISFTGSSRGSSTNRRVPPRAARERWDVARTGKKFGRQKGGGTARHGESRAPIFIRSDKAHGPRVRVFAVEPQQEGSRARPEDGVVVQGQEGNLIVVDNLDLAEGKTKALRAKLGRLGLGKTALVIDSDALNVGFARESWNRGSIDLMPAVGANIYDVMRHVTWS